MSDGQLTADTLDFPMADLFSGAGGLTLGLSWADFRPVFAFDADRYACETYRRNIGDHIVEASAADVTPELICARAGLQPGDFALVCGGPPCQGFSVQRRGQPEDPRNDLVLTFGRLAVALAPTAILMENVPGLLGSRGRRVLLRLLRIFEEHGYGHKARVLNAADYGVPQYRLRAFVVAWRLDRLPWFVFPEPAYTADTWRSVREGIGDLPEPPEDCTEHPSFANHTRVRISKINQERIHHVPPGGGRSDLPEHLQLPCHRNANGHRHLDVFGRMAWDRPSPTITALFDNFTRGRFAHPEQDRSITGREGARLQSFPDSFRFYGPKKDVARQIGNAVPPILALAVGQALVRALQRQHTYVAADSQLQLTLSLSD